jgi:hypothetical protein
VADRFVKADLAVPGHEDDRAMVFPLLDVALDGGFEVFQSRGVDERCLGATRLCPMRS